MDKAAPATILSAPPTPRRLNPPVSTYTQNDYNIWRGHFGQTAVSGAGATASAAVPEPATLMFMSLAAACVYLRRRRQHKSPNNSSTRETGQQLTRSETDDDSQLLIRLMAQPVCLGNSSLPSA